MVAGSISTGLPPNSKWYGALGAYGFEGSVEVQWCKAVQFKALVWKVGDTVLYGDVERPTAASVLGIFVAGGELYFILNDHKAVHVPAVGLTCKVLERRDERCEKLVPALGSALTLVAAIPLWHKPGFSWLIEGVG